MENALNFFCERGFNLKSCRHGTLILARADVPELNIVLEGHRHTWVRFSYRQSSGHWETLARLFEARAVSALLARIETGVAEGTAIADAAEHLTAGICDAHAEVGAPGERFFAISRDDYESQESFFLLGPATISAETFQEICDGLLPEAAANALARVESNQLIGWQDVLDELPALLDAHGFRTIPVKHAGYSGGALVERPRLWNVSHLLGPSLERVLQHNRRVSRDLAEGDGPENADAP